jgi:hypothetical protein
VRNAEAGSIDADRILLATLNAHFSWADGELELSDATAMRHDAPAGAWRTTRRSPRLGTF